MEPLFTPPPLAAVLAALALSAPYAQGFATPATQQRPSATSCAAATTHRCSAHASVVPTRTATSCLFSSTKQAEATNDATLASDTPPPIDAVVCGGGPAGLLSAIMLARTFSYKVKVYERLPPPPSPQDESVWNDVAKFYLIGLGERGQAALTEFGVWEDVEACCTAVPGRMDWAPDAGPDEGVERIFTDRPVQTQVLPRDKLVGALHQHILKNYPDRIELEYGKEVIPIDFDNDGSSSVLIGVTDCDTNILRDTPSNVAQDVSEELCDADSLELLTAKLLIAADGTQRTIANGMEKADKEKRAAMSFMERVRYGPSFHIKRYVDDNQRIYKTVPMKVPSKWRADLNYSARSKDGRILFDSLPADANGNQCGALLLKRADELAQENSDPKKLREAFDEVLPQFSALLSDEVIETVAKKPPSFLPSFRYAAPRLNQGDRTVVLGDAIHTVKPYFGLGANSALEDVQILKRSIESTDTMKEATELFSQQRADESKALVQISRELDRPGVLGVFTFILPLVVDSIFNKVAPKVFSPNTIAMLQKSENSFRGIRRRKRLERLGQVAVIGSFFAGTAKTFSVLTRVTGQRNMRMIVGSLAAMALAKKASTFLVPGLAPADVFKASAKGKKEDDEPSLRTIAAYDSSNDHMVLEEGGGI